jgi:hypothetical protein
MALTTYRLCSANVVRMMMGDGMWVMVLIGVLVLLLLILGLAALIRFVYFR